MPAAATQVHLFCPCGFLSVSSTPNAPTTTRTKRNAHGWWCGESCQVNYELKIYLPLLLRRSFTLELPRQRRLKRISLPWWQRGQTLWMIIVPAMGGAHRCARMFNVARARIALYRRVVCSRVRWSNAQFFVCISLLFVFPCLFFGTTLSNNRVKLSISLLADWPHE